MPDSTAAAAARREAANTPLSEMLRNFIENVRAHPGEIESNEHSITTPISWDGLGHAIHPLAVFEKMAKALAGWEAGNTQVTVTDEVVESACEAFHARTNTTWEWLVRCLPGAAARERKAMRAALIQGYYTAEDFEKHRRDDAAIAAALEKGERP